MSRRHGWLRFTAGPPLPHDLGTDAAAWQRALTALHRRWYGGVAPPQVAAVFVLQWLLQVVAHPAAYAATTGPWRARLEHLSFSVGPALVPDTVSIAGFVPDDDQSGRLERAAADYRAVAHPLAAAYPAQVRLGPHTRSALVEDMWTGAAREAEAAAGVIRPGVPERASCCLIYALPGCVECAGCPRLR
jgi:hypothetical protein